MIRLFNRGAFHLLWFICIWWLTACGAGAAIIIPTERPTISPTFTTTATRTPDKNSTPSLTPTQVRASPTGGPSPTALFGPSRTPAPDAPTPTRVLDPNAPRIEFFTSDVLAVEPGGIVYLFWSARGVENVFIYRLDRDGQRTQVWNVAPAGSRLEVRTRESDRGRLEFLLIAGEGDLEVQQSLLIPLQCPVVWFFEPAPDACPNDEAVPTRIIEQPFERGRMLYLADDNTVYVLFNDEREPAWIAFENRYDPTIHPELDETFPNPPGLFQPIAILGFVWRGNDTVRNRLGLGAQQESVFDGFLQTVSISSGEQNLFISSADGTVIEILPDGDGWQILTP